MLTYKIIMSKDAKNDIDKLMENEKEKFIKKINKDIENLQYMPRGYKTLYFVVDPDGEYRRMISGKYAIIYKIEKNQIIIIRIFNQKQNYLNSNKFILREKSTKYVIKK